jgi:hypothetical protein
MKLLFNYLVFSLSFLFEFKLNLNLYGNNLKIIKGKRNLKQNLTLT